MNNESTRAAFSVATFSLGSVDCDATETTDRAAKASLGACSWAEPGSRPANPCHLMHLIALEADPWRIGCCDCIGRWLDDY